ncbi:MAG: pilus assembly protein [Chloroflexi bacterium]|nr:pilus assembly protein [Chloroflexota bacterium]
MLIRILKPIRRLPTRKTGKPRPPGGRGQSLVELTLIFPLMLLLMAGMIQVAFAGNNYLTILDASRAGARFSSDSDPFGAGAQTGDSDCATTTDFYFVTACLAIQNMTDLRFDSAESIADGNDIVISFFAIGGSGDVLARYPTADGENGWSYAANLPGGSRNQSSMFSTAEVQSRLISTAPSTGVLLVEVFYNHHHIFQLPVGQQFLPDPVLLQAYTIMPLASVEPTATSGPSPPLRPATPTPTATPGGPPSDTPVASDTPIPSVTDTPIPGATDTDTPTPTASPTVTLTPTPSPPPTASTTQAPPVVGIPQPVASGCYDAILPGWAVAYDPDVGTTDGDGIANVRFVIEGPGGQGTVHDHTEYQSNYCAFGGNAFGCSDSPNENLADGAWSDTGQTVVNGLHTLTVIATDNQSQQTTAAVNFTVCLPATGTPTATPTLTPTPTPTEACQYSATALYFDDESFFHFYITNNTGASVNIVSIFISWPDSPNEQLKDVDWNGDDIVDGRDNSPPTNIPGDMTFKSGADLSLAAGETRQMRVYFDEDIAPSGYVVTVTFDDGCSVTVTQ